MSIAREPLRQIALSCLIALSCATAAWSRAEIFSNYSLNQAKQLAQKDGKLLLIDFTATWCHPCKKMESTTWNNHRAVSKIAPEAMRRKVRRLLEYSDDHSRDIPDPYHGDVGLFRSTFYVIYEGCIDLAAELGCI